MSTGLQEVSPRTGSRDLLEKLVLGVPAGVDLLVGAALLFAPIDALDLVGISTTAEALWLRLLGAQTASVGVLSAIWIQGERARQSRFVALVVMTAVRFAAGLVLVLGGNSSDGGEVLLIGLGFVEIALSVASAWLAYESKRTVA